nr:reverse transcriptase domain-containing protein [Tanacetum cinerariifolium]
MSEEDQTVDVTALPKFNMSSYESKMTAKDVKSLALRHGIPLDLHPVALTEGWTMYKLPDDMIGLNRLTMFELYYRSLNIIPYVNLLRVFYKVSKQGHWFSFEKRVGKGAGGQIFQETFSGLKGWKQRFFFLDRRVIPDAMAWRHHDSDINDHAPEDGFSMQRTGSYRKGYRSQAHSLRPSISRRVSNHLGLSWFPSYFQRYRGEWVKTSPRRQITKEGSKWKILKSLPPEREKRGPRLRKERKKQGGSGGQGSRPKTKRRKTAGRKDGPIASETTSSSEPIRRLNPHQPSGALAVIVESREDCSPHSRRALTLVNTKVIQPSLKCQRVNQGPTVDRVATPLRTTTQGANADAGESSREGALYESNALNNATALERVWFSLARGSLAQNDIFERFENLQTDFDRLAESHAKCGDLAEKLVQARLDLTHSSHLYTSLSDQHKALKNEHEGYAGKLEELENRNREPSQANKDQVLRIKELEDALAQKDSSLVYAERINAKQAQQKEKLVSHEYKRSLSEPFNLAIQAGWGKGLAEERSEEDLLDLMGRMEGFDVHADTKMRVEYDKLFERRYPHVEKISYGFCHPVSDLLKVYPDSPPHEQVPPHKPSSEKDPSTSAPSGSGLLFLLCLCDTLQLYVYLETDTQESDKNQAKNDKTKHKMEKIEKDEGNNWMKDPSLIIRCLEEGTWPKDKNKARCLRAKIGQYIMESGVLFKKRYLVPMLRCMGPLQANYVRAVVRKAVRQGYYWPTMHEDAKKEVEKCDPFQIHAPVPRLPKTLSTLIMAPWPLYQWGMDILGPLPSARGGAKFVIVQYYNKKVRPTGFRLGEFVFRRNEASRIEDQGKLGSKWEGPYRVVEAYENGSYKLQTLEDKEFP